METDVAEKLMLVATDGESPKDCIPALMWKLQQKTHDLCQHPDLCNGEKGKSAALESCGVQEDGSLFTGNVPLETFSIQLRESALNLKEKFQFMNSAEIISEQKHFPVLNFYCKTESMMDHKRSGDVYVAKKISGLKQTMDLTMPASLPVAFSLTDYRDAECSRNHVGQDAVYSRNDILPHKVLNLISCSCWQDEGNASSIGNVDQEPSRSTHSMGWNNDGSKISGMHVSDKSGNKMEKKVATDHLTNAWPQIRNYKMSDLNESPQESRETEHGTPSVKDPVMIDSNRIHVRSTALGGGARKDQSLFEMFSIPYTSDENLQRVLKQTRKSKCTEFQSFLGNRKRTFNGDSLIRTDIFLVNQVSSYLPGRAASYTCDKESFCHDARKKCRLTFSPSAQTNKYVREAPLGSSSRNRWLKRLSHDHSYSLDPSTKRLRTHDGLGKEMTSLFSMMLNYSITKSGFEDRSKKDLLPPEMPNKGMTSLNLPEKTFQSWIKRWCSVDRQQEAVDEVKVTFELQRPPLPSIAAMAMMGKVMNESNLFFKHRGSSLKWNAKNF